MGLGFRFRFGGMEVGRNGEGTGRERVGGGLRCVWFVCLARGSRGYLGFGLWVGMGMVFWDYDVLGFVEKDRMMMNWTWTG